MNSVLAGVTSRAIKRSAFTLCRGTSSAVSTVPDDGESLSSVHRGTAFENRAMRMLQELSMSLSRVGGKNDGGIDLQGWWWLPDVSSPPKVAGRDISEVQADIMMDNAGIHRRRVRVLAQCKAERKKLGPNYVRELEGVLYRHLHLVPAPKAPATMPPTVALLVSESAFTKATILCALSSPLPFFLLHLPRIKPLASVGTSGSAKTLDNEDGFASAVWNPALGGQSGVLGGSIDLRWELCRDPMTPRRPSLWLGSTRLQSWVPLSNQ